MPAFTIDDLNRMIEACVGADEAVSVRPENLDLDFDSLGLDSLGVYEVVTLIEDEWRVRIADDVLDTVHTPRELLGCVGALQSAGEAV